MLPPPERSLIEKISRKAAFIKAFLTPREQRAVDLFFGEKTLREAYTLILKARMEGFPQPEAEGLIRELRRTEAHLPSFLRHHTHLLITILSYLPKKIPPGTRAVNTAKTLEAGFTRYLILTYSLLKDIILTHANDFARHVQKAERFTMLIHALTGKNVSFTPEAERQFEKHARDERFKITAFEKIVRYLKGEERARTYYGLIDLGKSHEYVRILLKPLHGAYEIVWISTVNEHTAYEKFLREAARAA